MWVLTLQKWDMLQVTFKTCIKKSAIAINEGFFMCSSRCRTGSIFADFKWEALNLLKVKRINHGVNCIKDDIGYPHLRESTAYNSYHGSWADLSNVKL